MLGRTGLMVMATSGTSRLCACGLRMCIPGEWVCFSCKAAHHQIMTVLEEKERMRKEAERLERGSNCEG